jgi:hypothetical protein
MGRTLGWIAAWAWTFLAAGGGLWLLWTKGPWPLTNGWFALVFGPFGLSGNSLVLKKICGRHDPRLCANCRCCLLFHRGKNRPGFEMVIRRLSRRSDCECDTAASWREYVRAIPCTIINRLAAGPDGRPVHSGKSLLQTSLARMGGEESPNSAGQCAG